MVPGAPACIWNSSRQGGQVGVVMPCCSCFAPFVQSQKAPGIVAVNVLWGSCRWAKVPEWSSHLSYQSGGEYKQWCSLAPLALQSSHSSQRAPSASQSSLFSLFLFFVVRSCSLSAWLSHKTYNIIYHIYNIIYIHIIYIYIHKFILYIYI